MLLKITLKPIFSSYKNQSKNHFPLYKTSQFLASQTSYNKDYKLKENLVEDMHYILVPEKPFFLLKDRFGIENKDRDVISRPVVVGSVLQKEPFVEVYPLKLKVGC